MLKTFWSILLIFSFAFSVASIHAQNTNKRELRGVWVATVLNIDWPSKPGLSTRQQQHEIDQLLDNFKEINLNAVFLQIRPVSDAIYRSNKEPWSQYLTGAQGKAPNPLYDPLDYFIEGCHNRGLELHAWLNPFRVKQKLEDDLVEGHFFNSKPEWGWEYGTKMYLDPGIPDVREYVADIVEDVVRRYDVDGIHFDDYFYPYPIKGKSIPDSLTFNKYADCYPRDQMDNWRRHNVDLFIKDVSEKIKESKPWVLFGVSPFGVWRNNDVDSTGSQTKAGITAYDILYADVLKWIQQGWVDYLMPQIYWYFGHPQADFKTLADWWACQGNDRFIFVGHGLYRLNQLNGDVAWQNPVELPAQLNYVRKSPALRGSVWFSSSHFIKEKIGFSNFLKKVYYKNKAILPAVSWVEIPRPLPPVNVRIKKVKDNNTLLQWDKPFVKAGLSEPKFYVVYRCMEGEKINPNEPRFIFDVVKHPEILIKVPIINLKKDRYVYRISAIDKLNNESILSDAVLINQ